MSPEDVLVGVVTYNPEMEVLRQSLRAVGEQGTRILVYDNGSSNGRLVARSHGIPFVLSLDQDSVLAHGSIDALLEPMSDSRVAMTVATVVDRNLGETVIGSGVVNYAITSGSLFRVSAREDCGMYDQSYFIDFVDFDMCTRVRLRGYYIVRVSHAKILHSLGESSDRFFGRLYGYTPFRLEHMVADMVTYARMHRYTPPYLRPPRTSLLGVLAVLVRKVVLIALYEDQKTEKSFAVGAGIRAGLRNPITPVPNARSVDGGNPA